MTISPNGKEVMFSELSGGDCFEYAGIIYIKHSPCYGTQTACRLSTGVVDDFMSGQSVNALPNACVLRDGHAK